MICVLFSVVYFFFCETDDRCNLSVAGGAAQPSFLVTPQDQAVTVGRRAVLRCQVTGNPAPAVFWNKQSSQVIAKLHFTGPTGPDQTKSADFVGDPGLVGSGRASVVEFS